MSKTSEFTEFCKVIKCKGRAKQLFIEETLCHLNERAIKEGVNVWDELYKLKAPYKTKGSKGNKKTNKENKENKENK